MALWTSSMSRPAAWCCLAALLCLGREAACFLAPSPAGAIFLGKGIPTRGRGAVGRPLVPTAAVTTASADEFQASMPTPLGGSPLLSAGGSSLKKRTKRGQRLRATYWLKQFRSDLTSAEFALKLDGVGIDYDTITLRLEKNLQQLEKVKEFENIGGSSALHDVLAPGELDELKNRVRKVVENMSIALSAQNGPAAAAAVAPGSREGGSVKGSEMSSSSAKQTRIESSTTPGSDKGLPEIELGLFVREDGTVDWDGAIASGKEVAKFGQELWERINGQDPSAETESGGLFGGGGVARRVPEPESMAVMKDEEALLVKALDSTRAHAESVLQALKTAANDETVRKNLQEEFREINQEVSKAGLQLRLHRLNMDMETIYCCIDQDIKDSVAATQEIKLLVAEFGMLDLQLENMQEDLLQDNEMLSLDSPDGAVFDEGELELCEREINDLKLRLGMELQSAPIMLDADKALRYVKESVEKVKKGVDFYLTGTKLLGSDVQYASSLIAKAAQGYTLKPREVRMLRRSLKDLLTLIPTVIIFILPLTPVGHVLVFSFIQRFFPDFFPSTFTDRRQNLLKMYEQIEKKDSGIWDAVQEEAGQDDALEVLRRNFVNTLQQAGSAVGASSTKEDSDKSENSEQ